MSAPVIVQSSLMQEQHQAACQFLGLPQEDWHQVDNRVACSSHTWTHQDWVLQYRPRMRYRRMRALYQTAQQLDGLLPGFRYHGPMLRWDGQRMAEANQSYLEAEGFWMAQPRLHGASLFDMESHPEDLIYNLQISMPSVTRDLGVLSEQRHLDMFELYRGLPTHGIVQQNIKIEVLMSLVEVDPRLRRIADQIHFAEPTSPRVISHGDPTLKNLIRTSGSVELIDWESVWLLPRHRDFTHQVAFTCKYLPPAYWQQAINTVWVHAEPLLEEWNQTDWQHACLWQLLREAVFFPHHNPQTHQRYLDGLQELVDQQLD